MDGAFKFISTSEGKLVPDGSDNFEYVYNIKDHLGNVRVSFKDDGNGNADLVQQDHYYPFGMRMAYLSEDIGNANKYLYNEKEFNEDHNLYWYHYGARYYDPQLGRWWAIDPVDEFYSPYVYCGNNPVNIIDPDGQTIFEKPQDLHIEGLAAIEKWQPKDVYEKKYKFPAIGIIGDYYYKKIKTITYCNYAVLDIMDASGYNPFSDLNDKSASGMVKYCAENFIEISFEEATFYASEGATVFATHYIQDDSHICIVGALGDEKDLTLRWDNQTIPFIYQIGKENFYKSLDFGFVTNQEPTMYIDPEDKTLLDLTSWQRPFSD